MSTDRTKVGSRSVTLWGLGVLTAVMLIVDAVVHLRRASNYQLAAPGGIGAGNIFRIEAIAAILVAAYVLVIGWFWSDPVLCLMASVTLKSRDIGNTIGRGVGSALFCR